MIGVLKNNPNAKGMIISESGFSKNAENLADQEKIIIATEIDACEKIDQYIQTIKVKRTIKSRNIKYEDLENITIDDHKITIGKAKNLEISEMEYIQQIKQQNKRKILKNSCLCNQCLQTKINYKSNHEFCKKCRKKEKLQEIIYETDSDDESDL